MMRRGSAATVLVAASVLTATGLGKLVAGHDVAAAQLAAWGVSSAWNQPLSAGLAWWELVLATAWFLPAWRNAAALATIGLGLGAGIAWIWSTTPSCGCAGDAVTLTATQRTVLIIGLTLAGTLQLLLWRRVRREGRDQPAGVGAG
jgi:hypothetical protein